MEKKFYFKGWPQDAYTAEEAASMMMDDGFLMDEWLNENFSASNIFHRMDNCLSTETIQEDLEDTFRTILAKRIETDEVFREDYEIECRGSKKMIEFYLHKSSETIFETKEDLRTFYEQEGYEDESISVSDIETFLKNYSRYDLFTLENDEREKIGQEMRDYFFKTWMEYEVKTVTLWKP